MIPSLYKDFGRSVEQILEDPFMQGNKIVVSSTTENGIEIISEGMSTEKGTTGQLSARYIKPGFSIEQLGVHTDGKINLCGSLSLSEKFRVKVDVQDGRHEAGQQFHSHGIVGVEYLGPIGSITTEIDAVNGPSINVSTLFRAGRTKFGAHCTYDTQLDEHNPPIFRDYNAAIGYFRPVWNVSLFTTNKVSQLHFQVLHKVNASVNLGYKFDYGLKVASQKLTVACLYNIDKTSAITTKIDTSAFFSVAFSQQLSSRADLNISTEVDTRNLGSESHKFGLFLNLHF